jgi:hypothetical protein
MESTTAMTMYKEKKEENKSISLAKIVSNLQSRWETHELTQTQQAAQWLHKCQQIPSMLSKEHIARIQDQLGSELLLPEELLSLQKHFSLDEELQIQPMEEKIWHK